MRPKKPVLKPVSSSELVRGELVSGIQIEECYFRSLLTESELEFLDGVFQMFFTTPFLFINEQAG